MHSKSVRGHGTREYAEQSESAGWIRTVTMRINRAYLRISDYTVALRLELGLGLWLVLLY